MAENMKRQSNYYCDALIIGGGSAGLIAAIEAHDAGANVLIVSKSKKADPHTTLARGGINAALGTMDPEDKKRIYTTDKINYKKLSSASSGYRFLSSRSDKEISI